MSVKDVGDEGKGGGGLGGSQLVGIVYTRLDVFDGNGGLVRAWI